MDNYVLTILSISLHYKGITHVSNWSRNQFILCCLAPGESNLSAFLFSAFPLVNTKPLLTPTLSPLPWLVNCLKWVSRAWTSPSGIIPRFFTKCHGLGFLLEVTSEFLASKKLTNVAFLFSIFVGFLMVFVNPFTVCITWSTWPWTWTWPCT